MKNKFLITLLLAVVLLVGAYLFVKKIQRDRDAMLSYTPPIPHMTVTNRKNGQTETRTYTEKELEELRKQGKLPAGIRQPNMPMPPNNAGEDATQRALKTLNDINRINEMNQRLMDQQERLRRQQK